MERTLEELKEEILERQKGVELILISGSYAFGKMQKHSDVDMGVLTRNKPKKTHIFRFIEQDGRKVLLTHTFSKILRGKKKFQRPKGVGLVL